MSTPDPEVTFRLIGEDAKELEKHTFLRSQLSPSPPHVSRKDNHAKLPR